MTVKIIGARELRARLDAIKPDADLMRDWQIVAVAEQKIGAPRKTGNLARTIRVGAVSATYAETIATASYAAAVELDTRPHIIEPRNKKALRWAAKGSATLSGRVKKGGQAIFAKRVRHPGTKGQHFMWKGALRAIEKVGLKPLLDRWDKAG